MERADLKQEIIYSNEKLKKEIQERKDAEASKAQQKAQQEAKTLMQTFKWLSGDTSTDDTGGESLFGADETAGRAPASMTRGGAPAQGGGVSGAGASGMPKFPSKMEMFQRTQAGLPAVFPEEQAAIDSYYKNQEHYNTRNIDLKFPTGQTQSRLERLTDIAPNWAKSLYELTEDYGKNPVTPFLGGTFEEYFPTAFSKKIKNAGEATAIGKNFSTDVGGLHEAKSIISPAGGESKADYSQRLYDTLHDAFPSIEAAYSAKGQEVPAEFFNYMDKIKQNADTIVIKGKKYSKAHIMEDAEAAGITYEQALKRLGGKGGR